MPLSNPTEAGQLRSYGTARQSQIYQGGVTGQRPPLPVSLEALEQAAREALTPEAFDYVAGGAGSEDTMRANRAAFRRWRIVPRILRNVAQPDLRIHLFGTPLPAPVLLAPIGLQSVVHPEAELAVARAAASLEIPVILSTVSSHTLEEVAQAMKDVTRWFQLYWPKVPELAVSLVSRAERAGYSAIVVTLDVAFLGWRERDLGNAYLPFLKGEGSANYFSDPVFRNSLPQTPEEDPEAAIRQWLSLITHPSLTWDDLAFLRRNTRLPILLKGILHPEDAARAVECGMDGVIVSNHGGRQVDGGVAALDALPQVVEAMEGRGQVLFDSGIRRGADAVKAMALGAQAVLLGRPTMWGLALAGEQGVREVLLNFLADLEVTLALCGHTSCGQLGRSVLWKEEVPSS
jgi:lactate 2-monooxygenase